MNKVTKEIVEKLENSERFSLSSLAWVVKSGEKPKLDIVIKQMDGEEECYYDYKTKLDVYPNDVQDFCYFAKIGDHQGVYVLRFIQVPYFGKNICVKSQGGLFDGDKVLVESSAPNMVVCEGKRKEQTMFAVQTNDETEPTDSFYITREVLNKVVRSANDDLNLKLEKENEFGA